MKKLLFVFFLTSTLAKAGTVPNTATFSLQDVCTAIYGSYSAGMNLSQCFTDATGTFDPAYVGSKNSLLNFRNYSHVSVVNTLAVSESPNNIYPYVGTVIVTYEGGFNYEYRFSKEIPEGGEFLSPTFQFAKKITNIAIWAFSATPSYVISASIYRNGVEIGHSSVSSGNTYSIAVTSEIGDEYFVTLYLSR